MTIRHMPESGRKTVSGILDDPEKREAFIGRLKNRIENGVGQQEHERLTRLLNDIESYLSGVKVQK